MQVHYRWHPLWGQSLPVCGAHTAGRETSYVVQLPDGTKTHVPHWMTEAAADSEPSCVATPHVSVAALQAVRAMLDAVRQAPEAGGSQ